MHGETAFADRRFNRKILTLQNPGDYQYLCVDGLRFPTLMGTQFTVSCLTYRDEETVYVEVAVTNRSRHAIELKRDFILLGNPQLAMLRTNSFAQAGRLMAGAARNSERSAHSTPSSAASASNPLSRPATSVIAAGESGNDDIVLAKYLLSFAQQQQPSRLNPGKTRVIALTFRLAEELKNSFDAMIRIGGERFAFKYRD